MNRHFRLLIVLVLEVFFSTACAIEVSAIPIKPSKPTSTVPISTEIPKASPTIPAISTPVVEKTVEPNVPLFDQFILEVKTGEKDKIVGLWVEGKMALLVVYQPTNNPGFVSTIDDVATYFLLPYKMSGNYGMLAHNYLAGRYFFDVNAGDIIQLVFGDGDYRDFEVVEIKDYQALQPDSPRSEYIDLVSGAQLTANNLFVEVYMGDFHTTMQTCIARGIEDSWGRRFLLAPPL
jgi:hypothetical protein